MAGPILYIPVETRVREFDGKLLFALAAVKAGFQAVIGPKWVFAVNYQRLPRGVIVSKTMNRMDAPAIQAFRQAGHLAVAWDEEGPGQITAREYLRNVDSDAVAAADAIFSWGAHQTALIAGKYPDAAPRIATHGNPRWDLLRPEYRGFYRTEAEALRARFGRYILINTNFSFFNAWFDNKIEGVLKIATRTGAFSAQNPDDMAVLQHIYTFEKTMFAAYVGLIPKLSAAFPGHTIIVRPHPVEKKEYWHERLPAQDRVVILHEGSVLPWILGADTVLQTACTTGFESLTAGRPVATYSPFPSPVLEWHLASQVTPRFSDDASLIGAVAGFIADDANFDPYRRKGMAELAKHIAHLEGETAASAIATTLAGLAADAARAGRPLDNDFPRAPMLADYPRNDYLAMKFPPLDATAFAGLMQRLIAIDPSLGNATARQIAESCFLLGMTP